MMEIGLSHYLLLSAALFSISVMGVMLNRKNIIILLMSLELLLLGVNTNFVAFNHFLQDDGFMGHILVFFVLTVAAVEAVIGLAILVCLFRTRQSINIDELDQLKG